MTQEHEQAALELVLQACDHPVVLWGVQWVNWDDDSLRPKDLIGCVPGVVYSTRAKAIEAAMNIAHLEACQHAQDMDEWDNEIADDAPLPEDTLVTPDGGPLAEGSLLWQVWFEAGPDLNGLCGGWLYIYPVEVQ